MSFGLALIAAASVVSAGAAVASVVQKPKAAEAPSVLLQAPPDLPKPPEIEKVKAAQRQAVLSLQKKRTQTILTRAAGLPDETLNLGRASLLGR